MFKQKVTSDPGKKTPQQRGVTKLGSLNEYVFQ